MANIIEGAKVVIKGDASSLERTLKGSSKSFGLWQSAAVGAMAAVVVQGTRMAAQLDRDIRLVATLTGASTKEMGLMRKEIKALGVEFGRSFNELSQANYQAVSGGFRSINQSMAITREGTRLAVTGNAGLVASTEILVKWLNAFKMEADDAGDAAASLWGITRDGIVTVEQLGRFLKDLPLTFYSMGFSAQELSASLSTVTSQGADAAKAVDQMRMAVIQLEKAGIGGTLLERIGQFRGMGLPEIAKAIGGDVNAASGILTLAENYGLLAENIEKANKVRGDFKDAGEIMQGGALSEWERMSKAIDSYWESVGNNVAKAAFWLKDAYDAVPGPGTPGGYVPGAPGLQGSGQVQQWGTAPGTATPAPGNYGSNHGPWRSGGPWGNWGSVGQTAAPPSPYAPPWMQVNTPPHWSTYMGAPTSGPMQGPQTYIDATGGMGAFSPADQMQDQITQLSQATGNYITVLGSASKGMDVAGKAAGSFSVGTYAAAAAGSFFASAIGNAISDLFGDDAAGGFMRGFLDLGLTIGGAVLGNAVGGPAGSIIGGNIGGSFLKGGNTSNNSVQVGDINVNVKNTNATPAEIGKATASSVTESIREAQKTGLNRLSRSATLGG